MVAYCDVRLAKGVIGLRLRYLRGLDGGAICAAANVALGTLLLISSQAVAVPMEETLAFGADNWMGSNADGTSALEADGSRVHLDCIWCCSAETEWEMILLCSALASITGV